MAITHLSKVKIISGPFEGVVGVITYIEDENIYWVSPVDGDISPIAIYSDECQEIRDDPSKRRIR